MLVLSPQYTLPFTIQGLVNDLSVLALGDTLSTEITVHVEILQDMFSNKNVGSKI